MKSSKHKTAQRIVSSHYRKSGCISTVEHYIKGKKIDVLAQNIKTKYIIANEIELTPRHCLENIKIDLGVGCNEVVIICEDPAVLEAIRRKARKSLVKNILSKVSFRLIDEFIPHLNSGINSSSRNMREFNTETNAENNPE